jgi:hypothetical protein
MMIRLDTAAHDNKNSISPVRNWHPSLSNFNTIDVVAISFTTHPYSQLVRSLSPSFVALVHNTRFCFLSLPSFVRSSLRRILSKYHEDAPQDGPNPTDEWHKELHESNQNVRKVIRHEPSNHRPTAKKDKVDNAQTNFCSALNLGSLEASRLLEHVFASAHGDFLNLLII